MAFRSDADAEESRRAVSALLGLASREYIPSTSTDHHDLTPAVAGKAPLWPGRAGGQVPAPDVVLFNPRLGLVFGVEVEARTVAKHYPAGTFCDVAKLRNGVEVDVSHAIYARAMKGEDYDHASTWGQRDIRDILRAHAAGRLDFFRTTKSLLLYPRDLRSLDELWRRIRGESA